VAAALLCCPLSAAATLAQAPRPDAYLGPTEALPLAKPLAPPWSRKSGASGDPSMSASAIRAAASNFQTCLQSLWPAAARRGVSQATYRKYTGSLTPDLRIMQLLDT